MQRAIVEEQRERARAETRSVRLFLEGVHAEYAMPGSHEAFVRTFWFAALDGAQRGESADTTIARVQRAAQNAPDPAKDSAKRIASGLQKSHSNAAHLREPSP